MKPLNAAERAASLRRFTLLYLAIIAIPIVTSYFLFSNKSIEEENTRLRAALSAQQQEQQQLLAQLDKLTYHLQQIDSTDKRMLSETNERRVGDLQRSNQDYLQIIMATLDKVRSDSMQMKSVVNKRMARNALSNFDLFRSNRYTIDFLRDQIQRRGGDANALESMKGELRDARNELSMVKQQLTQAQLASANQASGQPNRRSASEGRPLNNTSPANTSNNCDEQIASLQTQLTSKKQKVEQLQLSLMNSINTINGLANTEAKRARRKEIREQAIAQFKILADQTSDDGVRRSANEQITAIQAKMKQDERTIL